MAKKRDQFDDFMEGMSSTPSRLGGAMGMMGRAAATEPVEQDPPKAEPSAKNTRMGRPKGSVTGGEKKTADYINKTFRISVETAGLLERIHKETELPYRDIIEAAVKQYAKRR